LTRRSRLLLAGALVLLAVAIGTWGLWIALGSPPSIVVSRSPLLDKPAPEITLATLDAAATVRLSDYRGRPVMVNFWASWCLPCRQEFPLFADARSAHAGEGLEILGIVHDDGPQAAQQFASAYGATWPLLNDVDDVAWGAYLGTLVPITYYIDREGVVRAVSYGPPPSGTLEEQLAKIL
jgi:cytochrome c biogenesis protein CcmG, thiol:disulfide interchange protein DsbE